MLELCKIYDKLYLVATDIIENFVANGCCCQLLLEDESQVQLCTLELPTIEKSAF